MAKKKEVKAKAKVEKKYKGVAIRFFGFEKNQYYTGDEFETTNKKMYDHLINIKRIK